MQPLEAERLHYSENKEAYAVITSSDGRKFPDTHEGRESARKREKFLSIVSIQQQVDPESPIVVMSTAGDERAKDCNTTTNRRARGLKKTTQTQARLEKFEEKCSDHKEIIEEKDVEITSLKAMLDAANAQIAELAAGHQEAPQGGLAQGVATNTKANYKSALPNPVFLKVFRSISGISNGKP